MIFYFSATGNSFYTAKRIASQTGDVLYSMVDCIKEEHFHFSLSPKEKVGIISPTYAWGLPSLVLDFLEKLEWDEKPSYLWFLATYGTTPGQTGWFAKQVMMRKNITIQASYSVKMPDTWTPTYDLSKKEKVQRINDKAELEIDAAIEGIRHERKGDFMERKMPLFLSKWFYTQFYDRMRQTKHLHVLEPCLSCGLCANRCPIGAIEMQEGKPVWIQDRCVMCLSCLHHCPSFAIQYGHRTQNHGQYQHP